VHDVCGIIGVARVREFGFVWAMIMLLQLGVHFLKNGVGISVL